MTEEHTDPTLNEQPPEGGEEQQDPNKTFDAEYVANLRKEAAKYRTEAKANAEAAQRLSQMEEAQKTELQRLQERAEQAEARLAQTEIQSMHARLAAEYGVPVEAIHGDDEDTARQSAQTVVEWASSTFQPKKKVPARGLQSGASSSDRLSGKERAAQALRQMRGV